MRDRRKGFGEMVENLAGAEFCGGLEPHSAICQVGHPAFVKREGILNRKNWSECCIVARI